MIQGAHFSGDGCLGWVVEDKPVEEFLATWICHFLAVANGAVK